MYQLIASARYREYLLGWTTVKSGIESLLDHMQPWGSHPVGNAAGAWRWPLTCTYWRFSDHIQLTECQQVCSAVVLSGVCTEMRINTTVGLCENWSYHSGPAQCSRLPGRDVMPLRHNGLSTAVFTSRHGVTSNRTSIVSPSFDTKLCSEDPWRRHSPLKQSAIRQCCTTLSLKETVAEVPELLNYQNKTASLI